jgi:hypothetical protein
VHKISSCGGPAILAFALAGCASTSPTAQSAARSAVTSDSNAVHKAEYLPIPEEFTSAVHDAEVIGQSLYQRDRAAERTTDALVASKQLKRPAGEPSGWLVSELGDGNYHVSYLVEEGGALKSYADGDYSATTDRASNPRALSPPRQLEPFELAQARAIKTAQSAEFLRCVPKYNVVTVPTGAGEPPAIHVYLIPSRDDAGIFPEGGFHDFTISADGTTVKSHYSQTKACLNANPSTIKGKLEALMNSHLTSPAPTAFHVFMNLNYRMNIFTVTTQNQRLWSISGGRIRLVSADVDNK